MPRAIRPPKRDLNSPQLIKLVNEYEMLWRPSDPRYRDLLQKEAAWRQIAANFWNTTGPQCAYLWEKLKAARRNHECRKRKRLSSGAAASSRATQHYKYEREMSFLPPVSGSDVQGEGNLDDDGIDMEEQPEDDNLEQPVDEMETEEVDDESDRSHQESQQKHHSSELHGHKTLSDQSVAQESEDKVGNASLPQHHTSSLDVRNPFIELGRYKNVTERSMSQEFQAHMERAVQSKLKYLEEKYLNDDNEENFVKVQEKGKKRESKPKSKPCTSMKHLGREQKKKISFESDLLSTIEEESGIEDVMDVHESSHGLGRLPLKVQKKIKRQKEADDKRQFVRDLLKKQVEAAKKKEALEESKWKATPLVPEMHNIDGMNTIGLAVLRELQQEKEEDSYTLFCLSMASRLRQLPKREGRLMILSFTKALHEVEESVDEDLERLHFQHHSTPAKSGRQNVNTFQNFTQVNLNVSLPLDDDKENCQPAGPYGTKNTSCLQNVPVKCLTFNISNEDLNTLKPTKWLNDKIINVYLGLLKERGSGPGFPNVEAVDTFFMPNLLKGGPLAVADWLHRIDFFNNEIVLVPVHRPGHWCLAVIDMCRNSIVYYDSMQMGEYNKCLSALLSCVELKSIWSNKEFNQSKWTLTVAKDIPYQNNGFDCGVFVCAYAERLSRHAKMDFSQTDMDMFRKKIADAI